MFAAEKWPRWYAHRRCIASPAGILAGNRWYTNAPGWLSWPRTVISRRQSRPAVDRASSVCAQSEQRAGRTWTWRDGCVPNEGRRHGRRGAKTGRREPEATATATRETKMRHHKRSPTEDAAPRPVPKRRCGAKALTTSED